jgi:hypothetical protein
MPAFFDTNAIETKIACLKLPGERLQVRDLDRKVPELLVLAMHGRGNTQDGAKKTTSGGRRRDFCCALVLR